MHIDLSKYRSYYKIHKDSLLEFYFNLLKIPSISTDPKHENDCKKIADFVENFLKPLGFETEIHKENHNYLIFASRIVNDKAPTLCFYGHTDVQPCDPLNLWDSPPFEPHVRDGAVFARGAQDNKGQLAYTLCAIESFIKEEKDKKQCNIKLIIEGEEESGSHGTEKILKKIAHKLLCDELYVVDFDAKSKNIPAIVLGMRGLCAFEFSIQNASTDLHSGMYGGVVYNPLRAISEMIASCFTKEGMLAIEGAYQDLGSLTDDDMSVIDFSFDKGHLQRVFHVEALCVPSGLEPRLANWILPTFEINGLFGGYEDEGVKTVLPKKATAKISCRIGKDQDPQRFIKCCHDHLKKHLPLGFKMDFKIHQAASSFYTSIHASSVLKSQKAFESVFEHTPWIGLSGASVPIVGLLSRLTGANVSLMGVGLDTDQIHAPNEHFSLDRFEKGFYSIIHILKQTQASL